MKHANFMLDLETFGTKAFSTIISIGCVHFDPTKVGDDAILGSFHILIDPINATQRGLRMDAETVMWWLSPDRALAWKDWYHGTKYPLDVSLDLLSDFVRECVLSPTEATPNNPFEQSIFWGNGPQFDCSLLRQAYDVVQRDAPWMHYNERCFRTMKNMPGAKSLAPPHEGVQHNALTDAIQQAKWLCNILNALNVGPSDEVIGKPMPQPAGGWHD